MAGPVVCADCGARNDPGDEFCGQCGRYLGWSGAASDEATTTPATDASQGTATGAPTPPPPVPAPPAPPAPVPSTPTGPPSGARAAPSGPSMALPPPPPPPPSFGKSSAGAPPPVPISPGPAYEPRFEVMAPPVMNGVTCRTCGLVNPPGRTFCQRCGAQLDPAVGTMGGAPRPATGSAPPPAASSGGGHRLAFAGIGLVIIAVVVGAALVFGGVLGGPSPSPTDRTALGSASPEPSVDVTSAPATEPPPSDPPDQPTDAPATRPPDTEPPRPTATPRVTPRPTRTPRATVVPTQAPPPSAWTCDDSSTTITDPLSLGWNLRRVDWANRQTFDRLLVTLDRDDRVGGNGTQVIVHVLPTEEVASTLKVRPPSEGATSLALGLFQDVRLTWSVDRAIGLPALDWVTLGKDDNGFAWLVVGVDADPCYSLQVPAWTADDPAESNTIQVTLDVRR